MAEKIAQGKFNERLSIHRKDEIGTLSMAFNSMTEEILKNDKLKNEFIASVSHELRTPLTSIKGWASTLRTGHLDNKGEIIDGLNIIEKESDRLTLMVEELLDFSRFISGKVSLKKDHIDIRNNLLYLEKQFMPRAKRQNINFEVKIQENISLIFADENRVNQVIINVLDNAFKFTPADGKVEMECSQEEDSIVIKVSDTGMGIPKDELPHVMEKFFKGKSSMSKNGLGLSISKEIMELHGGAINIVSSYGEGTKVTIKFPVDKEGEKA
jgi:signal transduction histidine kinase